MPIRERPLAPEKSDIDRRVGVPLTLFFLGVLAVPIVVQPIYEMTVKHAERLPEEIAAREARIRELEEKGETVDEDKLPRIRTRIERIQALDLFRRQPTLKNIQKYEDDIAEEAVLAVLARPWTQLITLGLMNQGNEKVMVGRDGWLFHRPGVFYVTGYGFRSRYAKGDSPDRLQERNEWDPLPAILNYHAQLEKRGIELVLVPVPVKAQVYPEKLVASYDLELGPPANIYTKEFFEYLGKPKGFDDLKQLFGDFRRRKDRKDLKRFFGYLGDPRKMTDAEALGHAKAFRTGGVTVIDLSKTLWDAKSGEGLYLPLDTHWTPLGMKTAAKALADELRARFPWLGERKVEYRTRTRTVKRHGDIFYQLDLPEWSKAFPEHEVEIEQVLDPKTNEPVSRGNPDSPVVLLGDSFTNVYSTEEPNDRGMRWGAHAGLGEHLMKELGRPIQVIAVNGGAPTVTRERLNRKSGVKGKRVVIWSFATRELITRDTSWALVRVVDEPPRPVAAGPLTVVGEVVEASDPPRQGIDPYPEAVTCTLYKVLEVEGGVCDAERIIAVEWVMKNFKLLRPAGYKAGDVHRLRLIPLAEKEEQDPAFAAVKELNTLDALRVAPPFYWVEVMAEVE